MELLRHQGYNKGGVLSDEEALHVINTNYEHEDITPRHSVDLSSPEHRLNHQPPLNHGSHTSTVKTSPLRLPGSDEPSTSHSSPVKQQKQRDSFGHVANGKAGAATVALASWPAPSLSSYVTSPTSEPDKLLDLSKTSMSHQTPSHQATSHQRSFPQLNRRCSTSSPTDHPHLKQSHSIDNSSSAAAAVSSWLTKNVEAHQNSLSHASKVTANFTNNDWMQKSKLVSGSENSHKNANDNHLSISTQAAPSRLNRPSQQRQHQPLLSDITPNAFSTMMNFPMAMNFSPMTFSSFNQDRSKSFNESLMQTQLAASDFFTQQCAAALASGLTIPHGFDTASLTIDRPGTKPSTSAISKRAT